ncbi:MAG TPA: DUF2844 domain-containing protein [Steroidobacteraceae bacterium]
MKLTRCVVCSIVLAATVAAPAFAALGGDGTSVQADLAKLKGGLRLTSTAAFTVHEITTSDGTVVREYVSPSDKVFAVSWRGPFIPDLRQMLGSYYGQYVQAASAPHTGHRHLAIQQPGLVMQSSGRMRAFFGRAWVPGLLPQNFSVDDIN